MLVDERTAGHGDDLAVGYSCLQALKRYGIGLDVVGRYEKCAIDEEEVGIRGGHALPFLVMQGGRQGQRYELVGSTVTVLRAQCFELLLHALQLVVVAVLRVFTADVGDGRRGEEASKRINMPVGIVALDLSVGERKEALGSKDLNEILTEASSSMPALRLGSTITLSVESSVPAPSLSIPPPSKTRLRALVYAVSGTKARER